jgi:hypothetical protein
MADGRNYCPKPWTVAAWGHEGQLISATSNLDASEAKALASRMIERADVDRVAATERKAMA